MSSLRLLNETSGSSVATVQVTNVFSEDFDVYKITMEHDGSTNGIDAAQSHAISFRRGGSEQFFIGNAEFKGGE